MNLDLEMNLLLKFVEPQYSASTLNGELYFSRNKHFIELEEKQLEKGIGDKREGNWSKAFGEKSKMVIIVDGKEIPIRFKNAVLRQTYSNIKELPICCFVLLNTKKDFYVDEAENSLVLKPEIEESLTEQFAGRDLIFFNEPEEFLNMVDEACKKEGLGRLRGLVNYYDDKSEPHPMTEEEFDKNPVKALLYKRKFFEFQKEYRIILKAVHEHDRKLNIGDINDVAMNLGRVEQRKLPLKLRYTIEG
ncbi:hypothetical protein J2S74_001982 [Evansella vedderi]|uniref:DUF4365 domain-containing protein n=1 Tax=Evansella vedderi TaxID=38282 RepID=A0ABT9ZVV6_9BACI|nr:hypothetical protein [Evansella vedderi]MDQ0254603.1 hypothetical protein [Evansella vedderi]